KQPEILAKYENISNNELEHRIKYPEYKYNSHCSYKKLTRKQRNTSVSSNDSQFFPSAPALSKNQIEIKVSQDNEVFSSNSVKNLQENQLELLNFSYKEEINISKDNDIFSANCTNYPQENQPEWLNFLDNNAFSPNSTNFLQKNQLKLLNSSYKEEINVNQENQLKFLNFSYEKEINVSQDNYLQENQLYKEELLNYNYLLLFTEEEFNIYLNLLNEKEIKYF
ncbi:18734_t:CDS:2, partial [Racocetra persica]